MYNSNGIVNSLSLASPCFTIYAYICTRHAERPTPATASESPETVYIENAPERAVLSGFGASVTSAGIVGDRTVTSETVADEDVAFVFADTELELVDAALVVEVDEPLIPVLDCGPVAELVFEVAAFAGAVCRSRSPSANGVPTRYE